MAVTPSKPRPPDQQQQKPPAAQQTATVGSFEDLSKYLTDRVKHLQDIASSMISPKKVIATALSMAAKKGQEGLRDAAFGNPQSLFLALLQLTELDLEPDGVEAALVPFSGVVTAQPMYQGLCKLLYSSGMVKDVYADIVYANEIASGRFHYRKGSKPTIHHEPMLDGQGAPVAAYAVMHLMTGGVLLDVMRKEDIDKAMAVSKTADRSDSPWKKWPMEQWKKTVIKRLSKVGPKSDKLRGALALDAGDYVDGEAERLDDPIPRGGVDALSHIVNRGALESPTPKERIETPAQREAVPAQRTSKPADDPRAQQPEDPQGSPEEPRDDFNPPETSAEEQQAFEAGFTPRT